MPARDKSESQCLSRKDRQVPVFISSTFRDTRAERDHPARATGPRLRQWGEERRLHLVDSASFEREITVTILEASGGLFYEFTG